MTRFSWELPTGEAVELPHADGWRQWDLAVALENAVRDQTAPNPFRPTSQQFPDQWTFDNTPETP